MLKRNSNPNLSVRFAQTSDEVAAAQRLRYRVFVEELGAHAAPELHLQRREIDPFDQNVQHLCLFDQDLEARDPRCAVVGVYRILTEDMARQGNGFYSEREFDLTAIKSLPGKKLELGRSCICPLHRGGMGMAMLWSALGQYIEQNGIEYLFGTASYHGISLEDKWLSLSLLHHQYLAPINQRAIAQGQNPTGKNWLDLDDLNKTEAMRSTPSLIKAYLRLGGKIGEGVYIDRDFNTTDVFVFMDTKNMIEKYKSIYGGSL